ncbi:MAG: thioesterase family protein [Propionibacteriaceae bacterium]|nr:thioesterase family protein [Propionibacteriaceae bacterium]
MKIEVPLRWADLDAQGHVNNARFLDYMQDARAEFLYSLGIENLLREGFAVASNKIEYYAPVFFAKDPLIAQITVDDLTPESVTLAYKLYQGDTKVAVARTTLSGYNIATRTRRGLPKAAQEAFLEILDPVEPLREIPWLPMNEHAKVSSMKVRWSDLDAYGHVNNAIIFDYVQEGRINFTAGAFKGLNDHPNTETLWFLARQDAWYVNPIIFRREPYVVRTGVARMGRTSVTFSSQVDDPTNGQICARAATVAVFADAHGKPLALTDELRNNLKPYLLAEE